MTHSNAPDYDARIRRAKHLANEHPFAADVLSFYQQLAGFQKTIYSEMRKSRGNSRGDSSGDPLRSELDCAPLMKHFPGFLIFLEDAAPQPIGEAAHQLSLEDAGAWTDSLTHFWRVSGRRRHLPEEAYSEEMLKEFILRAFLQPHVELIAERIPVPALDGRPRHCPRCESAPLLGVLRPEGDGGKRNLVCSFCFYEWEFRRIFCAACGEDAETKLPIYVAEQLSYIRIEACDTCMTYLRTVDLTKSGHAVPIVDDLAAIPLSLWAEERGYTRLQPNLLGT